MKKGINEVNLLGRCGEIQFASSAKGLNYAKFSVAVSNEWVDGNGEKKTKTEWIPVSCRDNAPNTGIGTVAKKYLKKGMLVCVKGRFETTSKDGNTYVVVVVDADPATSLFFYETQSPQTQQQPQQAQQQGYQPAPQVQQQNGPLPPMPSFPNGNLISDDDIPF